MKSIISPAAVTTITLLFLAPAYAVTGTCEAQGLFTGDATNDWTQEQNVTGSAQEIPAPLVGNAYQIECGCAANNTVNIYYNVVSALAKAGQLSGYYQLNNHLDIKTEVNDIPDATAVTPLNNKIIKENGSYKAGNTKGSVCRDDPPETRAAPVTIGTNTTLTLYVSKPFLGELVIPDTHIASIQAGWSNSSSAPNINALTDIAELHVQGSITVPQDCKINQGDTIQVDLGFINAGHFTTKNEMPEGYTPVTFDITYDCGDTSKIKNNMEMIIEGDDVASQYVLVARRRSSDNVPDVGIRMSNTSEGNINIPFIKGFISIDPSGRGSTRMQAYPINLVGGKLQPGQFHGKATITIEVK